MRVDPKDGVCRTCRGTLDITDIDDASMSVVCDECGDSYEVEPDAFNDGCMTYYLALQIQQSEEDSDDE